MKKLSNKERDLIKYDASDVFSDDISDRGLMDILSGNTPEVEDRPKVPYASQEDLLSRGEEPELDMMSVESARLPASEEAAEEVDSKKDSEDLKKVTQKKAKSAIERLNEIKNNYDNKIKSARSEDDKNSLLAALIQTLGQAGAAQSQRNVGMNVGLRPVDFKRSNLNEQRAKEDFKTDLSAIEQEIKSDAARNRGQITPYQKEMLRLREERLKKSDNFLSEKEKNRERIANQQMINTTMKMLNDDGNYKKLAKQRDSFGDVQQILGQVQQGNEAALASLGAPLARAMGEVGVLTDQDVKRYLGNASWARKLTAFWEGGSKGELPEDTIKDIKNNIGVIIKGLKEREKDLAKKTLTRVKSAYGEGADVDRIKGIIGEEFFTDDKTSNKTEIDPNIQNYADQYNLTYNQAKSIIDKRKRGK